MSRLTTALATGAALIGVVAAGLYFRQQAPLPPKAGSPEATAEQALRRGTKGKVSNDPADPPQRYVDIIAPPPAEPGPAVAAVPSPTTRPNVVLMLGCTIRKDQTSVHGGPEGVTPFLSKLAAEGAVFDDTIAAAPWTRAASTSILTGHYAVSIGMVEPDEGRDDRRMADSVVTLAEHMKERGYYTLGATANPNLSSAFGFEQGYEDYQRGLDSTWEKIRGRELVKALVDTLKANRAKGDSRPFYMRAMFIDAHAPRSATGGKLDPYREDDVPERVSQYRYHLHDLDAAVASLDEALTALGYDASNTVFIFASDHGEGMNYPRGHGFSHGQYLTPSTNHAVWIMRGPGVAPGQRIRGLSSQVDLVPTLLGTIGAPLADATSVEGRDWSALVRGDGSVTSYDHVWSDTWFQAASRAAIFTPTRQCQDDFGSDEKQVEKGIFVPGCYDRITDPLYTTPVQDDALMSALHDWRTDRTAHLAQVPTVQSTVNPELAEQLKKLGYRE